MTNFDDERLGPIWDQGHKMKGKNPESYCKDDFGNPMFRPSYGKESDMRWEVDTEELEIQAILRVFLHCGGAIQVYSGHNFPIGSQVNK